MRYPKRWLLVLVQWQDEVFLAVNVLLNAVFLRSEDATFSEHFYALKRVSHPTGRSLSPRQRLVSLALLAAVPYARAKAALWTSDRAFCRQRPTMARILKALLRGYESWVFLHQILYLFDRSVFVHPLLRLASQRLQVANDPQNEGKASTVGTRLKMVVPAMLFLAQMTDWYVNQYAPTVAAEHGRTKAADLPPPLLPQEMLGKAGSEKSETLPAKEIPPECPLCSASLVGNAQGIVAIPSGFMFCYPCLKEALDRAPRCPITGAPTKPADMLRVYLNH